MAVHCTTILALDYGCNTATESPDRVLPRVVVLLLLQRGGYGAASGTSHAVGIRSRGG